MRHLTLPEFAAQHGQTEAARMLGMTQGAIHKALRLQREIYVTRNADGSYSAEERRPFPATAKKAG